MFRVSAETKRILMPLIFIVAGFLTGAVIMLFRSYNPIPAYASMLSSVLGNMNSLDETIREATPPIFTATGFPIAGSAGFFNIGLSGQAQGGWLAAIWIALANPRMPKYILLLYAIIVGTLVGATIVGIAGVLRAYSGTNGVTVTTMVSYIASYSCQYLMRNVMSDRLRVSTDTIKTVTDNGNLRLDWLSNMFGGLRINAGISLALTVLIVFWLTMKKTATDFEIKVVGLNPFASRYAGMSAKKNIIVSVLLSGVFAGLGGVVQGLGTYQNYSTQATSIDIDFDGMSVSLLGGGTALGILLAVLLFSILKIGGLGTQTLAGISCEIVSIVIAAIIFFVAINCVIGLLFEKKKKNYNQPETITKVSDNSVDGSAVKVGKRGEV